MLIHNHEEDEEETVEEEIEIEPATMQAVEVGDALELSLNSIVGLTTLRTINLKGTIEDQEVIILMDCIATHNFIAQRVVDDLKLPITNTTHYGVIMGSGAAIKGKGVHNSQSYNAEGCQGNDSRKFPATRVREH